jgi:hypothetical protein
MQPMLDQGPQHDVDFASHFMLDETDLDHVSDPPASPSPSTSGPLEPLMDPFIGTALDKAPSLGTPTPPRQSYRRQPGKEDPKLPSSNIPSRDTKKRKRQSDDDDSTGPEGDAPEKIGAPFRQNGMMNVIFLVPHSTYCSLA